MLLVRWSHLINQLELINYKRITFKFENKSNETAVLQTELWSSLVNIPAHSPLMEGFYLSAHIYQKKIEIKHIVLNRGVRRNASMDLHCASQERVS